MGKNLCLIVGKGEVTPKKDSADNKERKYYYCKNAGIEKYVLVKTHRFESKIAFNLRISVCSVLFSLFSRFFRFTVGSKKHCVLVNIFTSDKRQCLSNFLKVA